MDVQGLPSAVRTFIPLHLRVMIDYSVWNFNMHLIDGTFCTMIPFHTYFIYKKPYIVPTECVQRVYCAVHALMVAYLITPQGNPLTNTHVHYLRAFLRIYSKLQYLFVNTSHLLYNIHTHTHIVHRKSHVYDTMHPAIFGLSK
jgi:hypothetical protein